MRDDLVSSTPRAFIYLLFYSIFVPSAATLFTFMSSVRSADCFIPVLVHLSRNLNLEAVALGGKVTRLSNHRLDYVLRYWSGTFLLLMLPYAFSSSEFGPVIAGLKQEHYQHFLNTDTFL